MGDFSIKYYFGDYNSCVDSVKSGIDMFTRDELRTMVDSGTMIGVSMLIHNIFCTGNYDDFGNVYLYDELDPHKVAEYILELPKYTSYPQPLIYCCVCYALQHIINRFYRELKLYDKNGVVNLRFGSTRCVLSDKEYYKKYKKALDVRIHTGYKQIKRN